MKKFALYFLTTIMLLSFMPSQLNASSGINPLPIDSTRTEESIVVNALLSRLNDIKAMDKSKLSSIEKKQLKKEVRTIKTQLKEARGGIYLSAGAIIIIILLLILIL